MVQFSQGSLEGRGGLGDMSETEDCAEIVHGWLHVWGK